MIQESDWIRIQVLTRDDLPGVAVLRPVDAVYIPVRFNHRRITDVWTPADYAVRAFPYEWQAWAFLESETSRDNPV